MHTLSLQPTPCGAVTSSSQAHSRPVFIGRSPANQILYKLIKSLTAPIVRRLDGLSGDKQRAAKVSDELTAELKVVIAEVKKYRPATPREGVSRAVQP